MESVIMPFGPVNSNPLPIVDSLWRRLQFALLPPHCLLCGARGVGVRY